MVIKKLSIVIELKYFQSFVIPGGHGTRERRGPKERTCSKTRRRKRKGKEKTGGRTKKERRGGNEEKTVGSDPEEVAAAGTLSGRLQLAPGKVKP